MNDEQNPGEGGEHLPDYVQPILRSYDPAQEGMWRVQMFRRTQLVMPDRMDIHDWMLLGTTLRDIGDSTPWWLGDWQNKGEEWFGEEYSQALDPDDRIYAPGTLANFKSVARTYMPDKRRPNLSYSVHQAIASVYRADPGAGEAMLDDAEANKLTRDEVRAIVNDWWEARHDEQARRHGARPHVEEESEAPVYSPVSSVYVDKLEAIAREFAKVDPFSWGMCRYCGLAKLEDIVLDDHDQECIWRMANVLVSGASDPSADRGEP